ncbi:hypothetical protein BKA07_002640 [Brevibacterium marinum]|uniref:Uncharacterized protein n=1 Tax=Brevibacterium marinum TaxID=418643 RepID=A0A846S1P5_9MICO|nr:hypothetical protein [Brevibacterium marinum]
MYRESGGRVHVLIEDSNKVRNPWNNGDSGLSKEGRSCHLR